MVTEAQNELRRLMDEVALTVRTGTADGEWAVRFADRFAATLDVVVADALNVEVVPYLTGLLAVPEERASMRDAVLSALAHRAVESARLWAEGMAAAVTEVGTTRPDKPGMRLEDVCPDLNEVLAGLGLYPGWYEMARSLSDDELVEAHRALLAHFDAELDDVSTARSMCLTEVADWTGFLMGEADRRGIGGRLGGES